MSSLKTFHVSFWCRLSSLGTSTEVVPKSTRYQSYLPKQLSQFEPAPRSGKVNVMLLLFSDCYKQDVDRTKKDTIRTLKTIYGWYKCTIRMSFYKTIFSPFLFPFQRNSLISHKIPLDSAWVIILQSSPLVGVDYLMVEDLSSILLSPLWIYSFEGSLLFFTIHFSYRHKCGLAGASVLRQDL